MGLGTSVFHVSQMIYGLFSRSRATILGEEVTEPRALLYIPKYLHLLQDLQAPQAPQVLPSTGKKRRYWKGLPLKIKLKPWGFQEAHSCQKKKRGGKAFFPPWGLFLTFSPRGPGMPRSPLGPCKTERSVLLVREAWDLKNSNGK